MPRIPFKRTFYGEMKACLSSIYHIVRGNIPKRLFHWPYNTKGKSTQIVVDVMKRTFVDENIKTSPQLKNTDDLKEYIRKERFDAFIVGSDQVWREAYVSDVSVFFLNFLGKDDPVKRIAYAGSFGIDKWTFDQSKTSELKGLAEKFDSISVRETSGIGLFKTYLKQDVCRVCDPTILISSSDYTKLIRNSSDAYSLKGKLFAYVLDKNMPKLNLVKQLSEELNLPSEVYSAELDLSPYGTEEDALKKAPHTVAQWVRAISECSFMVTDSFHGTVFSIIFHKPFAVIGNSFRGNARMDSLLSIFHLNDRIINDYSDYKRVLDLKEIDWESIESILHKERSSGSNFLLNALSV